ncbi:MAG: hypothetical protein F6K36_29070 [Symploca sp. SIO3C6]|uniref:Uncharacterized protein n=1 Tax=Symploca sp. SIO1C4 TaxID=2607765 RepID=A0A6B3NI65_9CYAN|nr:hypothetical protein [Symploca sp. SIO3C6]NER29341.1 hypothetical protein [Symploca sp. SIO1C4]
MASKDGKITLSAAVPIELKERVQRIARLRRWTLSQTIVIFLEEYLDALEEKLGIEEEGVIPTNKIQKE